MEAYTGFAAVYDMFMDNVPYEGWSHYLVSLLKKYNIDDGLVLELGCGTGSMTRLLAQAGYDMTGIDNAEEMLIIARQRDADRDILYLQQDMRSFELYGTVRAIISVCDCMNYILTEEELLQVFLLVNNYLDPGGIFIFDLNTVYKYKEILSDNVFAEDREEGSFIWDNDFDEDSMCNIYDLTLYIEESEGLYRKYTEQHIQRAYTQKQIELLLQKAGMELLAVYGESGEAEPTAECQRIYFIAKEKGKQS